MSIEYADPVDTADPPTARGMPPLVLTHPEQPTLAAGCVINDRYRIVCEIGRGGMASVFLARDEKLQRDVAVKVSRGTTGAPKPALREELAVSALSHPNIVAIFDAGEVEGDHPEAGAHFVVMEYVDGLAVQGCAPVDWQRAAEIVTEVCAGLAAAHERGIIHCDIKPGNILLDRAGRARIVDFGVAARLGDPACDWVHGSPSYVAPERLRGEPATPASDIFAVGGVLAFLLTGGNPPRDGVPSLPADLPPALRAFIARARDDDPSRRFSSATECIGALDRLSTGLPATRRLARRPLTRKPADGDAAKKRARVMARTESLIRQAGRTRALPAGGPTRTALASGAAVAVLIIFVLSLVVPQFIGNEGGQQASAAPVNMPDVRNQTFGAAIEQLTEHGINVTRVEVIYGPGALNQVVEQTPAPNAPVGPDDEVVLIVRTGR